MPSIAEIRRRLEAHRPITHPVLGRRQAAVAMILRDAGPVPEVLFIERASHPGDPWSGHMAFPGGRVDPGDSDPLPSLLEPARFVERPVARAESFHFPGILVGKPDRHVVWGLTYRFLETFFQIVGHPLPDRWSERRAG